MNFAFILLFVAVFQNVFFNFLNATQKPSGMYMFDDKNSVSKRVVEPIAAAFDSRFKAINYSPNTVFKITALYDYPTYIEFEADEVPVTIINPKKNGWQTSSQGNRFFFKPLIAEADTTMTIITNKREYFFEFVAQEPDAETIANNFAFYIKFRYPSNKQGQNIKQYSRSVLPNLDNPELYNFNYTVTGEPSIFPIKVFDDGVFTYFQFKEKGGVLPAIFLVDTQGFESLINFKVVGDYVISETVSPRFTLRYGNDIVCVFNEVLLEKEKVRKKLGM